MPARTAPRPSRLRTVGAALLLALPLGCLSPTLPLPPPNRPDVSPPDASGITTIIGRVPEGTTALAQNLNNGRLVGQVTADGAYELKLPAAIGDQVAIWYRDGLLDSGATQVTVPAKSATLPPLGGASGSD